MGKRDKIDGGSGQGASGGRRDLVRILPRVLLGVLLILVGILFLVNSDLFTCFLFYCAVYVFGIFFFIPGVALIIAGIWVTYRAFRPREKGVSLESRKMLVLDVACSALAFFSVAVLVSSGMESSVLSSTGETYELTVAHLTPYYGEVMSHLSPAGMHVTVLSRVSELGGGFIPTLIVALGNSIGMGTVGTIVIFSILTALLLLVLLRHPVRAMARTVGYVRAQVGTGRPSLPAEDKAGSSRRYRVDRVRSDEDLPEAPDNSRETARAEEPVRRASAIFTSGSFDFDSVPVFREETEEPASSAAASVTPEPVVRPTYSGVSVASASSAFVKRSNPFDEVDSQVEEAQVPEPEPEPEPEATAPAVEEEEEVQESDPSYPIHQTLQTPAVEAANIYSVFERVPSHTAKLTARDLEPDDDEDEEETIPAIRAEDYGSSEEEEDYCGEAEEDSALSDDELAQEEAEAQRLLDEALANERSGSSYHPAPVVVKPEAQPLEPEEETPAPEPVIVSSAPVSAAPAKPRTPSDVYVKPGVNLLTEYDNTAAEEQIIQIADETAVTITSWLRENNIQAVYDGYDTGASVTRFHLRWKPGAKPTVPQATLQTLSIKLKGNMSVRFVPVLEGCDYSAIEIGNPVSMTISFRSVYLEMMREDRNCSQATLFPLGKDLSSRIVTAQLEKLPHLLVAGSTGSGKTVFIHSLICSLIMRTLPSQLKLVLIDPKKVEFEMYKDMPHLFCPNVNEPDQAVECLRKLVEEMERRYTVFQRVKVSSIADYRAYSKSHPSAEKMPILVVIIDEFADLMMAAKEAADYVARLAAKARACGIHLVVATQRPSVQVITGDIKNNIPARVGLLVPTQTDSRVILDEGGAETLMGKGDLLARIPGKKNLIRCQSPFISDTEIKAVVAYLKERANPVYNPAFLDLDAKAAEDDMATVGTKKNTVTIPAEQDPLYEQVKDDVLRTGLPRANRIHRVFGISINRAIEFLDAMEREGLIGTHANGVRYVKDAEGSEDDESD